MPISVQRISHCAIVACVALLLATNLYAAKAKKLVSFGGDAGSFPTNGMTAWQGSFYGTTDYGAEHDNGTVYQLSEANGVFTFKIVYVFQGDAYEGNGGAEVTFDRAGNLYTPTAGGRIYRDGTITMLTPQEGLWKRNILYTFTGKEDGSVPVSKPIFDPRGNLYGATIHGGKYGTGVIFQLTPVGDHWVETVIHDFNPETDGWIPEDFVLDDDGSLLGFTCYGGPSGGGTIYRLKKDGDSWTFNVLYDFTAPHDSSRLVGRPIRDGLGNIYGMAVRGGTYDKGTLFKFNLASREETILHQFQGGQEDGADPYGNLLLDRDGNIWGATRYGGLGNGNSGFGTIFQYIPSSDTYNLVFKAVSEVGNFPNGGLVQDAQGNLYGTAAYGGNVNWGTIFQLKP